HRAKYLFHIRSAIRAKALYYSWFNEVAVPAPAAGICSMAACQYLAAFLFSQLYTTHYFIKMHFAYYSPLPAFLIKRVAYGKFFDTGYKLMLEFFVDAFFY